MTRNQIISIGEWIVVLAVVALDYILAHITGISAAAAPSSIEALAIILSVWPLTAVLIRVTGFAKGSQVIAENAAKFFAFIVAASALEYYLAMSPLPLNDDLLVRIDRMMGFDWPTFFQWVQTHAQIKQILTFAYFSLMYEAGFVLFAVSIFYPRLANRFPTALIVSALLTLPFLGLFPIEGPFLYFGHTDFPQALYAEHYFPLRAHTMTEIPMDSLRGLICFPSFHLSSAVIMTGFLRRFRFIFPIAILLNIGMGIGALVIGGHYLTDVLAGVAVGLTTLWIVERLGDHQSETRLPLFKIRK